MDGEPSGSQAAVQSELEADIPSFASENVLTSCDEINCGCDEFGETFEYPAPGAGAENLLEPYTSDLDYLEDHFRYISARLRRVRKDNDDDDFRLSSERSKTSVLKELRAKERASLRNCGARLALTRRAGDWLPRLERLVATRGLVEFEKWVLLTLVGVHISDEVKKAAEIRSYSSIDVGDLLTLWTDGLEEQVARRKHFYKSGTLLKEGLIRIESTFVGQLTDQDVAVDRRMMDFIVGLDSEAGDLVEGSHLYSPKVRLESVVLPPDQKRLVIDTIGCFEALSQAREQLGLDDAMAYGRGLVMLFYGPSGTGKTMLANGIANHVGKKIFLVNFPSLGTSRADEVMSLLFREARIHEAILFFDECDSIFESRDRGNAGITTLLTEIERHDGPIIMATNRPCDLDEAMSRRITLAIEFRAPDPHLRADIWRVHLPSAAGFGGDIDVDELARKYELTGGFIKNAVITALSFAVARDPDRPLIRHEDLERGAQMQLRSRLRMAEMERRVVPSHGLDWLVVSEKVQRVLHEIVNFEKARKVLYGQWGFDRVDGRGQGVICAFHGAPGTGKTQAAEGIAYEIGRPLRMVNAAELLSKYVGETAKNIDALFADLRNHDAVLLFEEAEGLFGDRTEAVTASDRYANVDTGLLLHNIERYPGLVILTTNMVASIDPAFQRRIRYVLEFPAPSGAERVALWRQLLPPEVPLAAEVDLHMLADRFPLTGGSIKNAVYRAAARAALRGVDERSVTMADLVESAEEEAASWERGQVGFARAAS
jgi:SpoVK/Ycf46/Vps4 family AAA+-type ATPase